MMNELFRNNINSTGFKHPLALARTNSILVTEKNMPNVSLIRFQILSVEENGEKSIRWPFPGVSQEGNGETRCSVLYVVINTRSALTFVALVYLPRCRPPKISFKYASHTSSRIFQFFLRSCYQRFFAWKQD